MEVKTRFNIGEKVYGFDTQHKIVEFEVGGITIVAGKKSKSVYYYAADERDGYDAFRQFDEEYCFTAEEEAIAYAKN